MKILVVDDEDSIRELLQMFLERQGHEVTSVSDGVLGIHTFRHAVVTFDCVISDYRMPRMDGISMLSEIRRMEPRTKLVLQSGDPGLSGMMQQAGIGDVPLLHKPYAMCDLYEVLERNGIQIRSKA